MKGAISTDHVRFCLNKGRARHYAKPPTVQDAFQSIQSLASSAALGKLEMKTGTWSREDAISWKGNQIDGWLYLVISRIATHNSFWNGGW